MPKLTIVQAAELLKGKVSLETLRRDTKLGTLAHVLNSQGNKLVDTAELQRVYGPLENAKRDSDPSHENVKQEDSREVENPDESPETAVVEVLREHVELLKSQLETANREKGQLLKMLENQTLMRQSKNLMRQSKNPKSLNIENLSWHQILSAVALKRIQQYPTLREAARSLGIDARTLRKHADYKDSDESTPN